MWVEALNLQVTSPQPPIPPLLSPSWSYTSQWAQLCPLLMVSTSRTPFWSSFIFSALVLLGLCFQQSFVLLGTTGTLLVTSTLLPHVPFLYPSPPPWLFPPLNPLDPTPLSPPSPKMPTTHRTPGLAWHWNPAWSMSGTSGTQSCSPGLWLYFLLPLTPKTVFLRLLCLQGLCHCRTPLWLLLISC